MTQGKTGPLRSLLREDLYVPTLGCVDIYDYHTDFTDNSTNDWEI